MKTIKQLNMLMPNIKNPRSSKRKLLSAVVHSVILYAAPIWSKASKAKKYQRIAGEMQRLVLLRVCRSYRTASTDGLCVIAGRMYEEGPSKDTDKALMQAWQDRWTADTNHALWTKRLIPNITPWVERRHGELSYQLTQLLTGHGCFRAYLYRFKKAETDKCWYCGQLDDAEHTFFICPRWAKQRASMAMTAREDLRPENIIAHITQSEAKWEEIVNGDNTEKEKERKRTDGRISR